MSSPELEEPWGLLICSNEERVPILSSKFTIGRNKDADYVVMDNKCVSGSHCFLEHTEDDRVWFHDTSTNGTLVEGNKVHRSKVELKDGVTMKLVFRKDLPELNLSYQFVDLRSSSLSATNCLNDSLDSEATIDMDCNTTDGENHHDERHSLKRKPTEVLIEEVCAKKPSLSEETNEESKESHSPSQTLPTVIDHDHVQTASLPPSESNSHEIAERTGGVDDGSSGGNEEDKKKLLPPLDKKDSIEETLICQICQEILHDCVSLQPCMHSYCAGCYSDWMEYSQECPACRNKVKRISKNHIVNNLVLAYLRAYPEKKRPEEDTKELDEKNKITKDMLYPKKGYKKHHYDYDDEVDDDEEEEEEEDEEEEDIATPSSFSFISGVKPHLPSITFPSPFISPPLPPPVPITCRQCPGHITTASSCTPSFVCSPSTNHVLCNCCLQPMPDRRRDPDLTIPPQKCDVCGRAFCHMYWKCGKFGCSGCLNLFKDMEFNSVILEYIINDNYYESEILKKYIEDKGLTIKDLLAECLNKLDSGEFTSSDTRTSRISSDTRTCYQCALKNFKDLAYQYREGVDDLPSDVLCRADCYYGRNCRTQKHNRDHCKKYNHICDQKRF